MVPLTPPYLQPEVGGGAHVPHHGTMVPLTTPYLFYPRTRLPAMPSHPRTYHDSHLALSPPHFCHSLAPRTFVTVSHPTLLSQSRTPHFRHSLAPHTSVIVSHPTLMSSSRTPHFCHRLAPTLTLTIPCPRHTWHASPPPHLCHALSPVMPSLRGGSALGGGLVMMARGLPQSIAVRSSVRHLGRGKIVGGVRGYISTWGAGEGGQVVGEGGA